MENIAEIGTFRNNPLISKYYGKSYTVRRWLEIIAELSYDPVIDPGQKGRAPRYSHALGIKLCIEHLECGTMEEVLKEEGIDRTTAWRWKQKYPSFRDMFRFASYMQQKHERYKEMLKTRYGY